MPHGPYHDTSKDGISIIAELKKQLSYVTNKIQPFFSPRQGKASQDPVSRNKVKKNLWLHKMKKAIQITKNNNKWLVRVNVKINQLETEAFYKNEKNFIVETERKENMATRHQQNVRSFQDSSPIHCGGDTMYYKEAS